MSDLRHLLDRDGVVLLEGAIERTLIETLRRVVQELRSADRPMSRQVLYVDGPVPKGRPPLTALMDQWLSPHRLNGPGSTRTATDMLRPLLHQFVDEPVLFQDLVLLKRAGQNPFPWHQDYPFWPVDRPDGVIVWIPLAASDGDSGALRFARGSHRLGPRPVVDLHLGTPQKEGAHLGFNPNAWDWFTPNYEVGDVVVFLPTTFHGSPSMNRAAERAAWSSIWLDPACRWSHANAPNHPLCRFVPDGEPVQTYPAL